MKIKGISLKEYQEIKEGLLEIGDVVVVDHPLGETRLYQIDSVTKKIGKCRIDDERTERFTREIGFGFESLPRSDYRTTVYTVYRKIST